MKGYKKFNEIEIDEIMKNVNKKIFVLDETIREEFKQVIHKGVYYPYIISSFGRIFSIYYNKSKYDYLNLRELVPTKNCKGGKGYYQVLISYNKKSITGKIHILLAEAFITNHQPEIKTVVNHLDGCKCNNYVWNLEWCTHKENVIHAYKNGLCKQGTGENSNRNKYTEKDIRMVCQLLQENKPIKYIHNVTKVSKRNIIHILKKESWVDTSSNFDFANYNYGKPIDYITRIEQVCQLLESNTLTLKNISYNTGISYAMVKNILNKKAFIYISSKYNISNFNNYEINKVSYKVQRLSKA